MEKCDKCKDCEKACICDKTIMNDGKCCRCDCEHCTS